MILPRKDRFEMFVGFFLVCVLAVTPMASGTEILIDFADEEGCDGCGTPPLPAPGPGTHYNTIFPIEDWAAYRAGDIGNPNNDPDHAIGYTRNDLVDSDGVGTGVDLFWSGGALLHPGVPHDGINNSGGDWGGTPAWAVGGATNDGFHFNPGKTGSVTLSGLGAGPYKIEVISSRFNSGHRGSRHKVDGVLADNNPNNTTSTGCAGTTGCFHTFDDGWVDRTILTWDNVIPVGGTVTYAMESLPFSPPANVVALNAMRITPEPTSLVLVGVGGLGLLSLRRRRSN